MCPFFVVSLYFPQKAQKPLESREHGCYNVTIKIGNVSGNVPNMPNLFKSVRFLTTGIVSGMAYAAVGSLYQQALYSIALVLFLFIMLINVVLNLFIKKRKED